MEEMDEIQQGAGPRLRETAMTHVLDTHPTTATLARFRPGSPEDIAALTRLYEDYLLEELDRIGHFAPGIPAAVWLNTFMLRVNDEFAGFCSADTTRYAIELVYVSPRYRGHGLARAVLADLASTCPQTMSVKAPLSPGGQALARKLGITVSHPDETEVLDGERSTAELHRAIAKHCPHKRTGDPRRPCRRCYRACIKRAAEASVVSQAVVLRAAEAMRAA